MGYNLLLIRVYWGYNPLTNHLLTSWDILVRLHVSTKTSILDSSKTLCAQRWCLRSISLAPSQLPAQMLEWSFHRVEGYVRRKGLHSLIWFDCGMNSKEVRGSLRHFPTDQLQGHRIKKVELQLLTGAFFATDPVLASGSRDRCCSGNIWTVNSTSCCQWRWLVWNHSPSKGLLILIEPPFLTDCVYNHECRILHICWRRLSGIGMYMMHVSPVYGIFWLVSSGLGWNRAAAAVFSALWFQRLVADAIQSRQLSSTVAWTKICELYTCVKSRQLSSPVAWDKLCELYLYSCVKPTHACKHRKTCN